MDSKLGAPSFNSMAWSHMHIGRNLCEAVSLKTQAYFRYCIGMANMSSFGLLKITRPMNSVSVGTVLGQLMV